MTGPTPSQTVGPFFHHALTDAAARTDLAGRDAHGRRIAIEGRVLDADGAPVTDAMIEIWQADADGRFNHREDHRDGFRDTAFHGFGRCPTDGDGRFAFHTVKPGRVPAPGNALQAPHVLVNVFARGLLRHLVTRIYFADEARANDADPVLGLIAEPERRATLIAGVAADGVYRFDIRLSGRDETVFFDV